MDFVRKENKYEYVIPLIFLIGSLILIYFCYTGIEDWVKWILILILLGIVFSAYKNFRKIYKKIIKIGFQDDKVEVTFKNGLKKNILKEDLQYSLLVKRYIQPIRVIEIQERKKGRLGKRRNKSIGRLKVSNWENLKLMAEFLVRNKFERNEWRFGIGFSEIMMLITLLLIAGESMGDVTDSFIEGIESTDVGIESNLSNVSMAISDVVEDEKERNRKNDEKVKKKFLGRFK